MQKIDIILQNDARLKEAIIEMDVDTNEDGIITQEEMNTLYDLIIPEGVVDLTGIEYANNLSYIEMIYDGTMLDFSKWKGTQKTITIVIADSVTNVDLSFLKTVEDLEKAIVIGNYNGTSISINYSGLKEVSHLSLFNNAIPSKLEELKGLEELKELIIDNSKNKNMDGLEIVDDANKCLIDLKGIESLKNLQIMHIRNCKIDADLPITDINVISTLKNLKSLYLTYLSISDINAISKLEKLENLSILVDGIVINNVEEYKQWYEKQNKVKIETPKVEKESKKEIKNENIQKPTRIPQVGINIVEYSMKV